MGMAWIASSVLDVHVSDAVLSRRSGISTLLSLV